MCAVSHHSNRLPFWSTPPALARVCCIVAGCSEALRAKLEEDRRERRRKLGLPEELTEEEKAREAEKARKKAEEEVQRRHVYVKPISGERTAQTRLEQQAGLQRCRVGASLLDSIAWRSYTALCYCGACGGRP